MKTTRKLLLNEKVEVRQCEEGLRGSWHSGVVVGISDMSREVKYDDLLCDTGNLKLMESIPVTGEIDGIYKRPRTKTNHRGRIRPKRTTSKSRNRKSQLRFGVCVDAFLDEAWWEGVIYDGEDGSDERLVFFPDEGDQQRFKVSDLRVSCEWDEFSGSWRERGEWVLVKLAEAHTTQIPTCTFIEQVWSKLRENYGFVKMISEWTCGAYSVWKKYFMEVTTEIDWISAHQDIGCSVMTRAATVRNSNNSMRRSRCTLKVGSSPMCSFQSGTETREVQIDDGVSLSQEDPSHGVNSDETKLEHPQTREKTDKEPLIDDSQCGQDEFHEANRNTGDASTSGRLNEINKNHSLTGLSDNKSRPRQVKPCVVQLHKLNSFSSSSSGKQRDRVYAFPLHGNSRSKRLTRWQIKRNLSKIYPLCNHLPRTGLISFSVRKRRSCFKARRRLPKSIHKSKAKNKLLTQKERRESELMQKEDTISGPVAASRPELEPKDAANEGEEQRTKRGRRNDSVCFVCQYGDDLLPCDHCTSSYHSRCIGLKEDPVGNWFCPSCRCGLCGLRSSSRDNEPFTEVCYQCSRQYHVSCIQDTDDSFSQNSVSQKFCSRRCFQICDRLHDHMQTLNPTVMEGLSWTIIRSRRNDCNIRDERVYPPVQLSQVMNVLHECFEPSVEPHTKRDLVSEIVYNSGSRYRRLDFHGFYVMALLKCDELACVATLRIHGEKVAEMPLIATPFRYRRRGMCRLLMYEMEKMLMEMGVERLVLPAISQLRDYWVNAFGFQEMPAELRQELSGYPFLVFDGTIMFDKVLSESSLTSYSVPQEPGKTSDQSSEKTTDQSFEESNPLDQTSSARIGLRVNRRQRAERPRKEKPETGSCDKTRQAIIPGKENLSIQGMHYKKRRRNENHGKEKTATRGSNKEMKSAKHIYKLRRLLARREKH